MGGGSYAKIANLFLKQLKYDRFFLEWDDDRAGSIEALEVFKDRPETEIVLGLLSSKTNTLDDEARVIRLLDEASKIIDKDRLSLSHQCGFASCDGGNELSEAEQWAKSIKVNRLPSNTGITKSDKHLELIGMTQRAANGPREASLCIAFSVVQRSSLRL